MVGTTLVKEWIDAGKRLTEALDQANFEVVASLWLYDAESDEWELMIASPRVEEEGPLEAYRTVQKALLNLKFEDFRLADVHLVRPNDDLVKSLRLVARTGEGINGKRLTRTRAGDRFIEDAYIYRLN